MAEPHFYKKGKAVRITGEAHALLAMKAEDYKVTQKEIASEAIILLVKGENIVKEATLTLRKLKKMGRWTFILSVILGILLGMALSLVIGLFWGVL